jgi:hypothetical protein
LIFSSPASAKLRLRSNSRSWQRKIKNQLMIKKLKTEYSKFYIISKIFSSRTMFWHWLCSFVPNYSCFVCSFVPDDVPNDKFQTIDSICPKNCIHGAKDLPIISESVQESNCRKKVRVYEGIDDEHVSSRTFTSSVLSSLRTRVKCVVCVCVYVCVCVCVCVCVVCVFVRV